MEVTAVFLVVGKVQRVLMEVMEVFLVEKLTIKSQKKTLDDLIKDKLVITGKDVLKNRRRKNS